MKINIDNYKIKSIEFIDVDEAIDFIIKYNKVLDTKIKIEKEFKENVFKNSSNANIIWESSFDGSAFYNN